MILICEVATLFKLEVSRCQRHFVFDIRPTRHRHRHIITLELCDFFFQITICIGMSYLYHG